MRRLDEISFDFSMNQILRIIAVLLLGRKLQGKDERNHQIAREVLSGYICFLFNTCGWRKKKKTTAADFQSASKSATKKEGLCHRNQLLVSFVQ